MLRLAALLLLLAGQAAMAQSQSQLNRLDTRGKMLGWEAVGRLDLPGSFCTGVLIAPDLVLTAAHCVVDAATGRPLAARDVIFRAGYAHGRQIAQRRGARIAAPKGFRAAPGGQLSPQMIRQDVALIRLDHGLTSAEADPFLLHGTPQNGAQVSVVSYGKGRAETLSRQRACNVTGRYTGGIMSFDCDVTFGSSGAPVFARDARSDRMRILSVISGGEGLGTSQSVAFGPTLPELVDSLKRQLSRENGSTVRINAGAKRLSVGQRNSTLGARIVRPNGG